MKVDHCVMEWWSLGGKFMLTLFLLTLQGLSEKGNGKRGEYYKSECCKNS